MVSLIISFYKRLDFLDLILNALDKQLYKDFEVIIAEDNNDLLTVEYINKARTSHAFKIKHVSQEDIGFRKNMILNKALNVASFDTVLFLDGDCIPHKNLISQYKENITRGTAFFGRRVMLGKVYTSNLLNTRELQSLTLMRLIFSDSKRIEEGLYLPWFRKMKNGYRGLLGCNWGVNKLDITDVNGFDEDYVHASVGEDNDIEWRLRLNGVKFQSLKHKAIVFHMHHSENYNIHSVSINNALFEEKKKLHQAYCLNGLKKISGKQ